LTPAGVKTAPVKIIAEPRVDVVDCPVKVNERLVVGANAPTAEVVDTPTNKCVSLILIAPTDDVVDNPVGINERLPVGDKAPTEEVVESPVKLILKSDLAVGEPTLEVAL
jgi:hypothetical protein